jgi:hypothetical protein
MYLRSNVFKEPIWFGSIDEGKITPQVECLKKCLINFYLILKMWFKVEKPSIVLRGE